MLRLKKYSSVSGLLHVFITKGCWVLSDAFLASVEVTVVFALCYINMAYCMLNLVFLG